MQMTFLQRPAERSYLFMKKKKITTREICLFAVFTAITTILGIYATFRIGNQIKIPTKFISVFFTGVIFGPVAGGFVGAIADFLNSVLMPVGAPLPQITAVEFLCGVVYGLCFYKAKDNNMYYVRAAICGVLQFVISMTIMSKILADVGYFPNFWTACSVRVIPAVVLMVVQVMTMCVTKKFIFRLKKYITKDDRR